MIVYAGVEVMVVGYNPIQLYAVNKVVEFVPYLSGILELDETSMTDQHWSVRKETRKK